MAYNQKIVYRYNSYITKKILYIKIRKDLVNKLKYSKPRGVILNF